MYASKQNISTPFRVFTGERNNFIRLPEAHVQKHIVQWSSFLLLTASSAAVLNVT